MIKRYKVVQDAYGVWGVLDTWSRREAFAGWDGCSVSDYLGEFIWWASRLNARLAERDDLWWSDYEEKGQS